MNVDMYFFAAPRVFLNTFLIAYGLEKLTQMGHSDYINKLDI